MPPRETTPMPSSGRGAWAMALSVAVLGAGTLAAVLSGAVGSRALAPPALPARVATPAPAAMVLDPATGRRVYAAQSSLADRPAAIVSTAPAVYMRSAGAGRRGESARAGAGTAGRQAAEVQGAGSSAGETAGAQGTGTAGGEASGTESSGGESSEALVGTLGTPVATGWLEGFYPIYGAAQRAFHVNWLLIASIHAQETAFSTAPSTYHGLNFAHCCGGPMQFNVTDGGAETSSTWALVKDSYRYAPRPTAYDHRTARHPSIYDDFDSIMAAAHLLELDGAGYALDDSAWWAAYDYYGHDINGVGYADEVIARAIGWSQHGFCANCGVSASLIAAVHAAYGSPVATQLEAEATEAAHVTEAAHARGRATLRRQRLAQASRRRRGR